MINLVNLSTPTVSASPVALRSNLEFHGLAVVSSDGYIGRSPTDITFDWSSGADKQHFFNALDLSSLCIMGRKTHELYPNRGNRPRLVISRIAPDGMTDPHDPHAVYCNVDALAPHELLQRIVSTFSGVMERSICVLGGSEIYELFLHHPCLGFDRFDLTVETNITHLTGVSLLPATAGSGIEGLVQTLQRSGLWQTSHTNLSSTTTLISLSNKGLPT